MQRHSVTSSETVRSLANGPSWGGGGWSEGEVCILRSPRIAASPFSHLSMGGVCGRSLTAGKILFTGRQTCSLYLVLWLCEWHGARSAPVACYTAPWEGILPGLCPLSLPHCEGQHSPLFLEKNWSRYSLLTTQTKTIFSMNLKQVFSPDSYIQSKMSCIS